jgi:hypothetical protein
MNNLNNSQNSVNVNNEILIELFSWNFIFESVLNCFFNEFKKDWYNYYFEEQEYKTLFVKQNLSRIIENFLNEEKFNQFISRLTELFNKVEFKNEIIDEIKKLRPKLKIIHKNTPITARYTTVKNENVFWISDELLDISKSFNFDIFELLKQIEIWWIKRNKSYFENLDVNARHRTSGKLEIVGTVHKDMIITIIENN